MPHFDADDDDDDAEWEDSTDPDADVADDADEGSVDTDRCPHCGKPVYEHAQQCPYCHEYIEPDVSNSRKPLWIVIGAIVALAAILAWWTW